jgi:streptogramin lyase
MLKLARAGGIMLVLIAAAIAALPSAHSRSAAQPIARLSPRSGDVDAGDAWRAVLTLRSGRRTSRARQPQLFATRGSARRAFKLRPIGPGRFRARIVFDLPGRWTIVLREARQTAVLGAVTARPVLTNALDVAVLPDRRLLVGDISNYVLAARPSGHPTIVAGNGRPGYARDGVPATTTAVGFPVEVASYPLGGFAVVTGNRVRLVDPRGGIATLAALESPTGLAFDGAGNAFVSELGGRIRRIDSTTRALTTYAGLGTAGYGGDGGPALEATLNQPHGLAVAEDGTLYVCDVGNNRLRKIDPQTGLISTHGTGLNLPVDVAVDGQGTAYVADFGNNRIARVTPEGTVTTLTIGRGPNGVALDGAGSLYFTERTLPHVRRLDLATGTVTTVLGP